MAGNFRSKFAGYNMRVLIWVCKACEMWHERKKPTQCISCKGDKFYYFASKAEAKRFAELSLFQACGKISDLRTQVKYPLIVNDLKIGNYIADFVYTENGADVIEDVKSDSKGDNGLTDVFKMKAKLVEALYLKQVVIIKR